MLEIEKLIKIVPNSDGIIISKNEIDSIEFYKIEENNKKGENNEERNKDR